MGPKKQDFWPRINILKGFFFFLNQSMNYGSSKSAKIVLSKLTLDVKNQLNFVKKKLMLWPNILSRRLGGRSLTKNFCLDLLTD
jgi:hypothetical protein